MSACAELRCSIVGAAFCPHPPLLLPEVAGGAAGELDALRVACRSAIGRTVRPGTQVVVLGGGRHPRFHAATARGTLAGFGVDLEIPLGSDEPGPAEPGPAELPLSLTVGAWLLRDALGPNCGAVAWSIADGCRPRPDQDRPVALLVMGDGSARRSTAAPGYLDDRAAGYDAAVASALASGDPDTLRVDVDLGDDLLAAGARTWRAAAGLLAGRRWDADLLYDDAPYGVGYFVAAWTAR